MKNLLNYEFYKLKRSRTLLVCGIVTAGLVLLKVLTLLLVQSLDARFSVGELSAILFGKLDGWHFAGGLNSPIGFSILSVNSTGILENAELTLLMIVFVTIFACSERASNTLKNICARGYGRTQVFFAKYAACAVGAALLFLISAVMSLGLGGIFWGFGPEDGCLLAILLQFWVFLCYFTFCYGIAMMISNIALSLVTLIIGPQILSLLLIALEVAIWRAESFPLSEHWFDAFFKTAQTPGAEGGAVLTAALFGLLYAGLSLAGSWLINRKRQI